MNMLKIGMSQLTRLVALGTLATLPNAACDGPDVDSVDYPCQTDAQCGTGYYCDTAIRPRRNDKEYDGVCVALSPLAVDAPIDPTSGPWTKRLSITPKQIGEYVRLNDRAISQGLEPCFRFAVADCDDEPCYEVHQRHGCDGAPE